MGWAKTTINCGKNSIHQHAERTMHCRRLSLYKERYANSWCRSHHYTERQLTATSTRCFLNICWTRWSQYHKHIFQSVAPSVMLSPPISTHLSARSLAVWPWCCVLRNLDRSSSRGGSSSSSSEGGHQWTHHTYQRLQCSAENTPTLTRKQTSGLGHTESRCRNAKPAQKAFRIWSGLFFYLFFLRAGISLLIMSGAPQSAKNLWWCHTVTLLVGRACAERGVGVRSVARSTEFASQLLPLWHMRAQAETCWRIQLRELQCLGETASHICAHLLAGKPLICSTCSQWSQRHKVNADQGAQKSSWSLRGSKSSRSKCFMKFNLSHFFDGQQSWNYTTHNP